MTKTKDERTVEKVRELRKVEAISIVEVALEHSAKGYTNAETLAYIGDLMENAIKKEPPMKR